MPTINATIFLAYKANECNKALVDFLLREKKMLKKFMILKVFLVKNVHKLDKKITKLPTMEWVTSNMNSQFIVGNSAIISTLEKTTRKSAESDSIESFWNDIMLSGGDDPNPEDEFARNIPSLVENISQQRNTKTKDKPEEESSEDAPAASSSSISSFEDDPLMKRFFENMETSPGESQYEDSNHDIS